MNNEEKKEEYFRMKEELKEAEASGNLEHRNELVVPLRDLGNEIDWGYREGQTVERRLAKRWERDRIVKVEGFQIHFRTMIMPVCLVRPAQEQMTQQTLF